MSKGSQASGAAASGGGEAARAKRPSVMTKRQVRWRNRIIVALALFACALVLERSGALAALFGTPGDVYAAFAIYLVPYLVSGYDVILKAFKGIVNREPFDEHLLMTIATLGAFALVLFPDTGPHMAEGVAVMLFYQVGELFQSYAVGRSRKSIADMMDIAPDYANVMRDGCLERVDPDEVAVGDEFVVKPGERIPIDGVVTEGSSDVDTAALTGESMPRHAGEGDEVVSGCVNMTGVLTVRATKPFGESTVSRILELVENASDKKARTESFITRFARVYTPVVTGLAALIAVVPPLLFGLAWGDWVFRGLTFLVVSCPCALVISVPLSFFGGIGGSSRMGILIKGGNYLEALAHVDTVVFDKTGTLTNGTFEVVGVHPAGACPAPADGEAAPEAAATADADELLRLAAHAEAFSTHPIAASVRGAYLKSGGAAIDQGAISDVSERGGHGVSARVDGHEVLVGNDRLMAQADVTSQPCELVGTILHVAVDGAYAGHIVIADVVKPDAAEAIARLHAAGVSKTVMLTGDRREVADSVASRLGIDECHAQLLPQDKVDQVERLLAAEPAKGRLAFVGDGINDAPVLTRADVGIAMGAMGSDAAIEAADVVLMDDKPSKIAAAIRISRKTMRIAWQNIVFALGVKVLVLVLAALGIANMWMAVFADVGVAILAILNAMRCMNVAKMAR
jgi:Cd2+/Zn2+-exporting ATPase